jgi:hypothetical protein
MQGPDIPRYSTRRTTPFTTGKKEKACKSMTW